MFPSCADLSSISSGMHWQCQWFDCFNPPKSTISRTTCENLDEEDKTVKEIQTFRDTDLDKKRIRNMNTERPKRKEKKMKNLYSDFSASHKPNLSRCELGW